MKLVSILAVLVACGGGSTDTSTSDTGPTGPTGPGDLVLTFGIEEDLIPGMATPPVGDFNGSIFKDEDASAVGPNDGAVPVEDVEVAIDLTAGDAVDVYTTGQLEPGIYWILGCLDVDANGCDIDDPITVPNENKFLVEAETTSSARIFFSMLNPS